ncbi:MAG: TetR/AcrR family transcriptional regulator [Rhodospirillales bacterium]|nr:MAG: TetR/AcrR family transcriptional regulator [Rhodospirillales bacterium]
MPWEKQFDKDEVLDKAMQAFWMRGYEATSMQNLVDCTGINRGSLYATYGDKRALFMASLRLYDDKMRRRMLSELEERYAPLEAIQHLFLAFVESASPKGGNKGCFLTNTALELAQHDAEIGAVVARSQEEIEDFFVRMIRKGKTSGNISASVKPAETARGLLASLIGLIVLTRSRPEKSLLKSIADEALHRLT